jgi:hypothetical protein
MTKKPLVPNKNPKGRGKGKAKAAKVGNAVKTAKAAKAPRRNKLCSRLSKGRLTKLIAEVDSIAKGLKGGLSGGGLKTKTPDKKPEASAKVEDYYERIKGLFSNENKENIKRLKEDLVIDILGTMAGGLEKLVDFKTNTGVIDEIKKSQLIKFISIIKNIDNLGQEHISKIIMNDRLKGLSYIDKITTLVMINILKKVYNSRNTTSQLEEPPFEYLNNTKSLIEKITTAYKDDKEGALKGLTEDVKRELEYYNNIYILKDYAATKDDENDAKIIHIIKWMKDKCIEIDNNEFKSFINNPLLERNKFTIVCNRNNRLLKAIEDYDGIIKIMKDTYNSLDELIINLNNNSLYLKLITNTITNITFSDIGGLLTTFLYELYEYIDKFEDIMKEFSYKKNEYIKCVKVFYDDSIITSYGIMPVVTDEYKQELKDASIGDNQIKGYEEVVNSINSSLNEIIILKSKSNEADFYKNIPIDIDAIIIHLNNLCNAYAKYYTYRDEINNSKKMNEEAKAANEEQQQDTTNKEFAGGKLTTKYISTGDFVYILYEKKRIRRCVYAKTKGRGKYCKIKGDYILLSKLKVV